MGNPSSFLPARMLATLFIVVLANPGMGNITTVSGYGIEGFGDADSPATAATLDHPASAAVISGL